MPTDARPRLVRVEGAELGFVDHAVTSNRTIYYEMVQFIRHLRRVRALRLKTRTPSTFTKLIGQGVRNPLPWALVQTINGMIAKGVPQFERIPLDPKNRQEAQDLADTCWPLIQTLGKAANKDWLYAFCDQLSGDGVAIPKLRRLRVGDYPKREGETVARGKNKGEYRYTESADSYNRRVKQYLDNPQTENVLGLSQVDSATFWPDRNEIPQYVIEAGQKPLLPTLNALGKKLGTNNAIVDWDAPGGTGYTWEMQPSGLGKNVEYYEVWTKDTVYFKFGGETWKMDNELEFIPYSWRFGMTTSIPDPALERVSTLFPFFALDPYINTVLTGLLTWGIMASMPTATIETPIIPGNQGDSQQPNVDLPLGKLVRLKPGEKFSYQVPPPLGREATEVINMMLSFYDRAGMTSAARGNIGTRTPGLTFTSALEAAADMVGPIQTGLAGTMTDICTMVWRAIEKLDMPMNVTGSNLTDAGVKGERARYKITPSMINNYYDLACELQAFSTQELIQRGMHSKFMMDSQLWSYERASKFAGVNNPEKERREILLDEVRASALYKRQAMLGALEDDPEQVEEVQLAMDQGVDLLAPATIDEAVAAEQGSDPEQASPGDTGGTRHREGMPAPASGGGRPEGMPRQPTGPGHNGSQPQERNR